MSEENELSDLEINLKRLWDEVRREIMRKVHKANKGMDSTFVVVFKDKIEYHDHVPVEDPEALYRFTLVHDARFTYDELDRIFNGRLRTFIERGE